jgi:gamma-butyrobetaine dioxygenase
MTADDAEAVIAGLFASEGAADYLGEPVSQAAHMLLAAALAEQEQAGDALIAAALLHDIGHFAGAVSLIRPLTSGPEHAGSPGEEEKGSLSGRDLMRGTDNRHAESGASWLARWFGEEVTEPVRLHVAAKRYLCATEPGYAAVLSPASVYTLRVQGGPMQGAELAEFEANRYSAAAIRVRRWDDAAKDPRAPVPPFEHFVPVLRALAR